MLRYFELSLEQRLKQPVTGAIGSTNESLSLWMERADAPLLRLLEPFSKGAHHQFFLGIYNALLLSPVLGVKRAAAAVIAATRTLP